jgi:hypothetical protein
VDLIFASRGASYVENKKADCLIYSGTEKILGIKTVKEQYPDFKDNTFVYGLTFRARNFTPAQLSKFRLDFEEVIKNNKTLVDYMKAKHYSIPEGDIVYQINLIKKLDSSLN